MSTVFKRVKVEDRSRTMYDVTLMFDVYEDGKCVKHVWRSGVNGKWFEIPAGNDGEKKEIVEPPKHLWQGAL